MAGNRLIDLTGRNFGKLTVLELTEKRANKSAVWRCRCDCGTLCEISYPQLIRGIVTDCGCGNPDRDLTGRRFSQLTVLKKIARSKYLCECDCGKEQSVTAGELLSGHKKSCGCLKLVSKTDDITGMRSGTLVAVEKSDQKRRGCALWHCRCDCGNKTKTSANALLKGGTKSCGCGKIDAVKETIRRCGTVADHQHFIDGTCVERINATYKLRSDNKSGHTGIQFRDNRLITFKQQTYYLGSFEQLEDALHVRKKAEGMLFEPFLDWYHNNHAAQIT